MALHRLGKDPESPNNGFFPEVSGGAAADV